MEPPGALIDRLLPVDDVQELYALVAKELSKRVLQDEHRCRWGMQKGRYRCRRENHQWISMGYTSIRIKYIRRYIIHFIYIYIYIYIYMYTWLNDIMASWFLCRSQTHMVLLWSKSAADFSDQSWDVINPTVGGWLVQIFSNGLAMFVSFFVMMNNPLVISHSYGKLSIDRWFMMIYLLKNVIFHSYVE